MGPALLVSDRPSVAERAAERLWSPFPAQRRFLARREYEVLFGGAAGPGKTDALLYGGLRQIGHPRYHAALFRRTYPRLQEVMDRAARTFPQLGGTWNEQKKRWVFPSGAIYSFHHVQQERNRFDHLGAEYQYLAFDQLEEFPALIYDFLLTRVRSGEAGLAKRVRASANPGGVGHAWIVKRWKIDRYPAGLRPFVDPETGLSRVYVPARVWDNPAIVEHDPAYVQRLMAIPDPAMRRAYLEGDWSVFAGQYFQEWDPTLHLDHGGHRQPPEWWEVAGSLDWGYSPHPSVMLLAAFDDHGRGRVYQELVAEQTPARDLAAMIAARLQTPKERTATFYGDTQMWTPNPDSGVSIADEINGVWADAGLGALLVKANKDRINGWSRVHSFLDPRRPQPGSRQPGPWLTVLPPAGDGLGCPYLIETLPAQVHDEARPGDLRKHVGDDAVDALRYLLIGREPLATVPLELRPRPTHEQRLARHTRRALLHAMRLAQTPEEADSTPPYDLAEGDAAGATQGELEDLWQ